MNAEDNDLPPLMKLIRRSYKYNNCDAIKEYCINNPTEINKMYCRRTPLYDAVINYDRSNINVIKTLLECGAKTNIKYDSCLTVLHVVSSRNFLDVAKLLLDCGADANLENKYGFTPFGRAVCHNYEQIVYLYLDYDAYCNKKIYPKIGNKIALLNQKN